MLKQDAKGHGRGNRKTGPDVKPPAIKKPPVAPGTLPKSRIPIYDYRDRMRGHVGPLATSVTVSRFIGQHGAELGKKNGRTAWVGPKPPQKPKPTAPAQADAAPPSGAPSAEQNHTLEISLKADKGSVSGGSKKPETHARPRRG